MNVKWQGLNSGLLNSKSGHHPLAVIHLSFMGLDFDGRDTDPGHVSVGDNWGLHSYGWKVSLTDTQTRLPTRPHTQDSVPETRITAEFHGDSLRLFPRCSLTPLLSFPLTSGSSAALAPPRCHICSSEGGLLHPIWQPRLHGNPWRPCLGDQGANYEAPFLKHRPTRPLI